VKEEEWVWLDLEADRQRVQSVRAGVTHCITSHSTLSIVPTSLSSVEHAIQAALSSLEQPSIDDVSLCFTYVRQVDKP